MDALVENQNRAVRGNRALIAIRLLLAVVSLVILLLQESRQLRLPSTGGRAVSAVGEVTTLIFSPDGKRLFSGGSDATIRRWDVASGAEAEAVIEGHGDLITRLALAPDGKRILSASTDNTARIYSLAEERWSGVVLQHEFRVLAIAWSPDGERVVTGGGRNPLQLWNARTAERLKTGGDEGRGTTFAAYLPGGQKIVTADGQGLVRFWKAEDLAPDGKLEGHLRAIQAAALSPDGRWLVTGGGMLSLWDMESRSLVRSCEGQEDEITSLSFAADNEHYLSAGRDRQLVLWSVKQRQPVRVFGTHPDWVLAAALSPDGKLAVSGTGDRNIRVWNTETGELLDQLVGHRRTLRTAYAPVEARHVVGAPQRPPLALRPQGLVLILMCLLSILYAIVQRRKDLAPKLLALQVVVDLGLVTALVYHTGGTDSPFVTLYLIVIGAAAFVLSWRGAVVMAALAATLFSLLTLAYGLGYIPETFRMQANEMQLRKYGHLTLLDYLNLLLLPVLGFFLIALLAGNLSRRLALTRLLHHEVLEGIGEGILVLDLTQKVLYHNQEVRHLLLWNERIEGRTLAELLGEPLSGQAEKSLAEGTGRRLEFTYRRRDGLLIPFEARVLPFRDPDGLPRGLIVVLDDITAEKKMEEFYKHKERLETMGQLSATIAHEIRNPLASIRGAVQEIARSVEIPENKKILIEIVLSESDRLDQIITDFLRYARVRTPKLSKVDLCQMLTDIRLLLASRPEAKDVGISLEAEEDLEPIQADPEQLRQIFLNLGLNALQAVEGRAEQKVVLRLKSARLRDAQGIDEKLKEDRLNRPGVRIEVADTGKGMTEEVRKQLFEPFFTTKPNGTGLGLATVERLVHGHEGLIGVESRPEVGTSFFIWLPADLESEPVATAKSPGIAARRA